MNKSAEQNKTSKGRGYGLIVKIQGILETQTMCLLELK